MARLGMHQDPAATRDAALRRIRLTRGWMITAAAGLTAALAALASAVLPGKSLGAKARTASAPLHSATASQSPPQLPAPASAGQLGLGSGGVQPEQVNPPAAAPQPAPESAPQPSPPAPQPSAPAPQPSAPAPQPAPSGGGAAVSGGS